MNDPTKWKDSLSLYQEFQRFSSNTYSVNFFLREELSERGFISHSGEAIKPLRAETLFQMCWMRAVLDTKLDGWASDIRVIREHPDVWSCSHPTIVALATKYRLMRGIL